MKFLEDNLSWLPSDNPVIYLPQIDYLVNATFHIHAISDSKKELSKEQLKLEGKRLKDTAVSPELLNTKADNYFTDGSVCQETGKAGAAAVWINDVVCTVAPFGIQTKITNKVSSMAAELKGIETALEHCICTASKGLPRCLLDTSHSYSKVFEYLT